MVIIEMSLDNKDEDEYDSKELELTLCSSSIAMFARRLFRICLNQAVSLENRSTRLTYCRVSG
jgi:hypothetical protein